MPLHIRVPVLVFAMGTMCLSSCGAESKPRVIPAREIDAQFQAIWISVLNATPDDKPPNKKRQWKMLLTTWLPDEWPPSPRTTWTRYAYGLDLSMDGASDVSAPIARVERRVGDDAQVSIVQMAGKLKVIAIHPVRPHGGWHYTPDDEKRMIAMALALTSAPPADSRGGIGLKSYFESWMLGNAEIAKHVEPRHRAFFAWVRGER